MENLLELWQTSGIYNISIGQVFMLAICLLLIYLAIHKNFEPLLPKSRNGRIK